MMWNFLSSLVKVVSMASVDIRGMPMMGRVILSELGLELGSCANQEIELA